MIAFNFNFVFFPSVTLLVHGGISCVEVMLLFKRGE